jgi:hypothetical protein
MTDERPPRAEQQGDGQPENARELEDAAGGAALAGDGDATRGGRRAERPAAGDGGARPAGEEPRDVTPRAAGSEAAADGDATR